MSHFKERRGEDSEIFNLIGSQISLTPRSNKHSLLSYHINYSSCTASTCGKTLNERPTKHTRPKSADFTTLNPSHSKHFQSIFSLSGDSSLRLSHFTDLSSKLLQNLLRNPSSKESEAFGRSFYDPNTSSIFVASKPESINVEKYLEIGRNYRFLNSNITLELQKGIQKVNKNIDLENCQALSEVPEVIENKSVTLSEWQHLNFHPGLKLNHQETCSFFNYKKNNHSHFKNNLKPFLQEAHTYQDWQKESTKVKMPELKFQMADSEVKSWNAIKNDSVNKAESLKSYTEKNEEISQSHWENFSLKNDKKLQITDNINENLILPTIQSNLQDENTKSSFCDNLQTCAQNFMEETENEKEVNVDKDLTWSCAHQNINATDSTYEEIVHLLQTLEEEDSESINLREEKENEPMSIPEVGATISKEIDYLSAVSYLEEIEKEDNKFNVIYDPIKNPSSKSIISPRLEELLSKNSVELAYEVFSLKIQIEDQKKGIKLLKDTLAEMKEAKKSEELNHQEALHKVTSESETLIQRHQKFIKQLLNEKKNLNETVSKLVQELKSGEEKYKKNIKAVEEKHLIEIKRAKEAQAAADKIKREKWLENKTKKIKEMTVKGLEPELSRMAARQQEEMTELRNLHKAELEAVELRAARRNSELMDELRAELTKEKERAITKETANLRTTLEKEFENEKNRLQQYCQSLKERVRKQEERLLNQELEFQQRLMVCKQEEERKIQKIIQNHQEKLEEIQRQHLVELRNIKESEETDKQVLLNNYKKEQAAKLLEKEAEIHQQYKKERDKEIEMVIEAFERESAQIQSELNIANENRLKKLKEKMETDIKEVEVNEANLKVKLSEAKSKLSEKEDIITELNSRLRQLQTELTFFKKSCEEMSLEKAKLNEVVRGEFENSISGLIKEKEILEKEITVLKELHTKELLKKDQLNLQVKYEMQKELTRVYNRIKTAVNKKEKIIESLREENGAVNQKCRQLEFLLDQQRRNLLLQ